MFTVRSHFSPIPLDENHWFSGSGFAAPNNLLSTKSTVFGVWFLPILRCFCNRKWCDWWARREPLAREISFVASSQTCYEKSSERIWERQREGAGESSETSELGAKRFVSTRTVIIAYSRSADSINCAHRMRNQDAMCTQNPTTKGLVHEQELMLLPCVHV